MPTENLEAEPFTADFPCPDLTNVGLARVTGENLLVKLWPPKAKTPGGLEIPHDRRKRRQAAWVLAAGPETKGFQHGDTVICPTHALQFLDELAPDTQDIAYVMARDVAVHYPKE